MIKYSTTVPPVLPPEKETTHRIPTNPGPVTGSPGTSYCCFRRPAQIGDAGNGIYRLAPSGGSLEDTVLPLNIVIAFEFSKFESILRDLPLIVNSFFAL
jgi:hypothetical protein